MRILDFSDGFTSAVQPIVTGITASDITNVAAGNIAATNVQAALNELDTEKMAKISSVDQTVPRFSGTGGAVQGSGVTIDSSNNVVIPGNLQVNGTTFTVNSTTLDVADKNITIAKGGNDAAAEGAGLTVDRTSTKGSLVFDSTKTTKFKLGLLGSEVEIADIASSQTLTNKTLTSPAITTPTGIVKGDVGLGNVDNTSDVTKNAAAVTLTNKTISGSANTISNIALTSQVTGTLPIANGGTANASLPVTAGGVLYTDGTKVVNVGAGSSGNLLQSNGASAPTWVSSAAAPTAPTVQRLTSTGTGTGHVFTCTSANATVGAVYSNNGYQFVVLATIASSTILYCSDTSGPGVPLASGTLTRVGGATGDATITYSANQALATYTTPSGPTPLYIKVRMVGGGGGGSGSGTTQPNGGAGSASRFGTALLVANGGAAGTTSIGGVGGTASLGTGPIGMAISGANGSYGQSSNTSGTNILGGGGGVSPFGGAGNTIAGAGSTSGSSVANSGSGGPGAGISGGGSQVTGAGGGAGGYIDAVINTPTSTYFYAIGAAGTAGVAGTGGSAAGAGGSGVIIVEEFYQ
jgi:hypothetical protein